MQDIHYDSIPPPSLVVQWEAFGSIPLAKVMSWLFGCLPKTFASHCIQRKYCQVTVFRAEALVTLLLASVDFQNRLLSGQTNGYLPKSSIVGYADSFRTKNQETGADHVKQTVRRSY